LGRVTEIPAAIWETLRAVEPPGSAVLRLGGRPSGFAAAWQTMRDASAILPGALVHGSPARGAVRAVFPDPAAVPVEETLRALAGRPHGFAAERLAAELWPVADRRLAGRALPDEVAASRRVRATLMRRVKDTYDP